MHSAAARRTATTLVASLALVTVLAGCRPIHYDGDTGVTTSSAVRRVRPISVAGQPGLEVRFRHCTSVRITSEQADIDATAHLRPAARVTDAAGTVFFDTISNRGTWVEPAGSEVVDDDPGDDLQRIVVPVAGASGALRIQAACTTYPGFGTGPSYTFTFAPCSTTTRSCASSSAGTGTFDLGG